MQNNKGVQAHDGMDDKGYMGNLSDNRLERVSKAKKQN